MTITIREALEKYSAIEVEILLAHILNKPKDFLYLHPNKKLTTLQLKKLGKLISRRASGEPIAYIVGYKFFYGLRFKTTKDALIPRPETELLVDKAIELINSEKLHIKTVVDIGTGSGCIPIAIKKNISQSLVKIYASDVSKKALLVAKGNAIKHRAPIRFYEDDLLTKPRDEYDLIIANLPYGWNKWKNNSSMATRGLQFEPAIALFTEKNGLALIEKLLKQIFKLTQKPKVVLLEFDPRQKQELGKMIKRILPKSKSSFTKDLGKHWRIAKIEL
jgi:release factor glutamine methyltransferase